MRNASFGFEADRSSMIGAKIGKSLRPQELRFTPVTARAIPKIEQIIVRSRSRANDFTVGGILMWAEYFHYEYCMMSETLFVKGVSEIHPDIPAFSLPIGRLPMNRAVKYILDYCHRNGVKPRFSAVPEDRLEALTSILDCSVEEMPDWSDYIYDLRALAELPGKRYGKKRNHVNRFVAENPDYFMEEMSEDNVKEARKAYLEWLGRDSQSALGAASAIEESVQTLDVLDNFDLYPFDGLILRGNDGRIVAFAIGEVIGDTVYVHIEKMNHSVAGAGEMINQSFARTMGDLHWNLRYINREEDAGDPGLRQAKLSYHPAMILKKYDVIVNE